MIRECLIGLMNTTIDIGDLRKGDIRKYVDSYDEEQLFNIMRTPQGLLAKDINIFYFPGAGFRCSNDINKIGRLPICNVIQKILNDYYNSKL
jgi:hypothetical protein